MKYLRETVIRDIIDLIDEIKDGNISDLASRFTNHQYMSSVAKRSKDLIMTFPVICSNTLDPKTAAMITKAIERKCVTMMHLIFCSNTMYTDNAQDIVNYFHHNINIDNMTVDDMMKITSELDEDGIFNKFAENTLVQNINNDMKEIYHETAFEDSVNETSIQDFRIRNHYGKMTVVNEGKGKKKKKTTELDVIGDSMYKGAQARKNLSDVEKNDTEYFKRALLDNDAKKCNELVPSLLIIRFLTAPDSEIVSHAVVGVKARLIPLDSFEIMEKIFVKHSDKNVLLKLVKASTREISFFKDFLFAVDKAKIDALSNSRRGSTSRIWKALERRANKSALRKALRNSNDASAITSLVITAEEVSYMKKNYNIDLDNASAAKKIMESYNLLSIAIVDESLEVVKFLFDGDGTYETLAFSSLERESGDSMYKKVITLMSKMNR